MSKALICSDLHIHAHKDRIDRLHNCVEVLNWIFEQAEEQGCDNIFFLGDLFHERDKIDVRNYLHTFECFMKHLLEDGKDVNVYLLVGNHDMYHRARWDVNSIRPFSAIPNLHVIQSPLSINIGGTKINWLPHTENPLGHLKDFQEEGVGDILLAHLAVHGALTNLFYGTKSDVIVEYDNEMTPVDVSVFDPWDMTILGHYHGAQQLSDKVEYVGSPLQLSFGEAFQKKHVIILDLDTKTKTYVENKFSPKHFIVNTQDVENEAYDLNGHFVRLTVEDTGRKDLIDIKRKIHTESQPLSLDVKKEDSRKKLESEEDLSALEDVQNVLANIEDVLEQYVQDMGVPAGLKQPHLLKIGKQCLVKK